MAEEVSPTSAPKKRLSRKTVISLAIGVVVFTALGAGTYFYFQQKQSVLGSSNNLQEQVKQITGEVGKLIVLPEDEVPQVATVSDVGKLKDQPFFAKAKNGDQVLIYTKAQKAILYDPAQKRIVEVGPINIAQPSPTGNQVPAELRVALYNGTSITGLTTTTEKSLKAKLPQMTTVYKGNAVNNTYTKTYVVDLTGKNAQGAALIAQTLGGEVSALPKGELKPTNADIAVILGQ